MANLPLLKFTGHISLLTLKTAHGLRILIRVYPHFNEHVLVSLYYAFLHSHISYCIYSWGNTYQIHLAHLQQTQNQALRIITYSHFSCNVLTLLRSFNILSIGDLNKYSLCVLTYKFCQENLLILIISKDQNLHFDCTRFSHHNNYLLPKSRNNYGKITPNFLATSFWNSIPQPLNHLLQFILLRGGFSGFFFSFSFFYSLCVYAAVSNCKWICRARQVA